MSHTPGPWTAHQNKAQKEVSPQQWEIGLADSLELSGFIGIRNDAYMLVGGVCTEADARLMAAAPELLSACIKAVDRIEAEFGPSSVRHHFLELYSAIAKAKGKS